MSHTIQPSTQKHTLVGISKIFSVSFVLHGQGSSTLCVHLKQILCLFGTVQSVKVGYHFLSSHPVFVLPNKYVHPSLYVHFSGLADLLHILICPEIFKMCITQYIKTVHYKAGIQLYKRPFFMTPIRPKCVRHIKN